MFIPHIAQQFVKANIYSFKKKKKNKTKLHHTFGPFIGTLSVLDCLWNKSVPVIACIQTAIDGCSLSLYFFFSFLGVNQKEKAALRLLMSENLKEQLHLWLLQSVDIGDSFLKC